ncbi:thymocyte nuclear protein 1 isoform X2 [Gymnodraco acuticeps]|uniref:Thymocyte nuclear protein 1 n=1 Tax=Gymnodraco acuticeps TaxID=8218 RepID=A0A6P8T8Y4_GYMAC|nr:thymocyte nuclear protein 1 isoform X2 [Gymnodraco acuticeps]
MPPKTRSRVSKRTADSGKVNEDEMVGGKKKAAASVEPLKTKESSEPPQYSRWLMKSEPESRFEKEIDLKFGIEELKALPDQTGCWDGVRNYQARNFMRQMKDGQLAFFYHSNCKEPGIAGIMKVDVQYQRMVKRYIPLSELKKYHLQHRAKGGPLKDVGLFTRARLSVQPLTTEEFEFILTLEDTEPL